MVADGPGWELWDRARVAALVAKWSAGRPLGHRDDSAFIAILGGRILQREFGISLAARVAESRMEEGQVVWMMERQGAA